MTARLWDKLIWVIFLLAGLSVSHIFFFWYSAWQPIPRSSFVSIVLLGTLFFIVLSLWFMFDGAREGVLLASIAIIVIDAVAILSAKSLNLSMLSYSDGFNLEVAFILLTPISYFLGRFISSLRKQVPAQYEEEPEQRESSD